MDIDLAELASLVALLKEADFTEFRYDKGETHIVVRRGAVEAEAVRPSSAAPAAHIAPTTPAPLAAQPIAPGDTQKSKPSASGIARNPVPGAKVITAPMLGTFYGAPKPGEPPFVHIGDAVGPDSVVCIVEVMKLMNSVSAEVSGTIVAIHAENGELVEFGQPLFSVQESSAS
ncbi:MAG TPA: acetyl-CoA carboxylase biotin carboxyl carrier protein [Eoetvoesiella sp.]|jgi:acetyl-CoA carboxylase biotin carboxyl carrier protein|uniref:acetyl-CoA carboxylase biotin carboxyl carrier protein n=1 Tax=Eoetvoesiella sp. TaxID=1966355 RepID=UPI002CB6120F|nr:acetyl-CoA carboxylase biotin carboxyl carrier protein [Eoetvoesiella sp.]HWK61559.1 acetyl-CoA carboxylase biotin carboxyl carrier protein [Eoetvoesiella sp.]